MGTLNKVCVFACCFHQASHLRTTSEKRITVLAEHRNALKNASFVGIIRVITAIHPSDTHLMRSCVFKKSLPTHFFPPTPFMLCFVVTSSSHQVTLSKLHDILNYMMSTNRAAYERGLDFEGYFNCIECLTPAVTLFRQISPSSPSSIKLTKCVFCKKDVDPYIEREWILVFLDVLLHRLSANRHFYLHRTRRGVTSRRIITGEPSLSYTLTRGHDDDFCNFSLLSLNNSYVSCIFFALVTTLLDVYLRSQANAAFSDDIQPKQITLLLIFSFIQLWIQVLSIYLLSSHVVLPVTQRLLRHCDKRFEVTGGLQRKIFNCLSIPVFYMKLLVSSILIWENSSVVRGLGVLLTYSQQYLSLFCIIEHEIVMIIFFKWLNEQQKLKVHTAEDLSYWVKIYLKKNFSQPDTSHLKRGFLLHKTGTVSALCLLTLGASIIMQIIFSIFLSHLSNSPLPCSGFYVPFHRKTSSDILLCIG